jgi:hypothetical protein
VNQVGYEPANFALVTTNGLPAGFPPDPLRISTAKINPDFSKLLLMAAGDTVVVSIRDTPAGVRVRIVDLDSGANGEMTASKENGFAQIIFDQTAAVCSERPYAFHPMYSTSSVHTRASWLTHSFNVAFSDEIGHFEYCDAADPNSMLCTSPGINDKSGLDADDYFCIGPTSDLNPPPYVQIGGCLGEDDDFDGVSYHRNWPGTDPNPFADARLHPEPIRFTSPTFRGPNGPQNYGRVAFENDAASIELGCDVLTGDNCVNPPPGAALYPLYSDIRTGGGCPWQFGGPYIPGIADNFGGSAKVEFGALFPLLYQFPGLIDDGPLFEVFRRQLDTNPCPARPGDMDID